MLTYLRLREKYGVVRVSTAYEFFMACWDYLKFDPQSLERRAKPTFEATAYHLYYYAADENDEMGKTLVSATLDRKEKWNCNALNGSSDAYEVVGLPQSADGSTLVLKRHLPCPCQYCLTCAYAACQNEHIVGDPEVHEMKLLPPTDCPDILSVPLSQYTVKVLSAFITLRGGRTPNQTVRKDVIIKFIVDNYSDYINFHNNDDVNEEERQEEEGKQE